MKNYLILSNDFITIEETIKNVIKENNLSNDNVIKYDMNETLLENAIEELNTYGLFVDKKIVVLTSCDFLTGDKKRTILSQNESLLEEYINNSNELCSLIICTAKLDERKKLSKLLRQKCIVVDAEVTIEEKIKNNLESFSVDNKTINYLINYLKNDNERIINEFEKLKSYKLEEKKITISDIEEIVIKDVDEDIFTLINSIVNKDIEKSFKLYERLRTKGEEVTKIVITLLDQFRLIYKTKVLMNDGKSKDTIVSMLKEHPYRIKLAMEASYSFTCNELINYMNELGKIDINTKTGNTANEYSFDLFLLNI